MKIGLFSTSSYENPAGLARFEGALYRALVEAAPSDQFYLYVRRGSPAEKTDLSSYKNVKVCSISGGKLWREKALMKAPKSDVYIFNGLRVPLFAFPRNSLVVVLDLGFKNPKFGGGKSLQNLSLDWLSGKVARKAGRLVAISKNTKSDFEEFYPSSKGKIEVIYPGFKNFKDTEEEKVAGVVEPFLLHVGVVKERKNVLGLAKAFKRYRKELRGKCNLVIAGNYNDSSEYFKEIKRVVDENNLKEQVLFIGQVTDSQLAYLYKHATALVFVSFLEGFGFPVLEAMSSGLPVIASDTTALGEVAGRAAICVDPLSEEDIAEAMVSVTEDNELREKLISSGRERSKDFSWNRTGGQFMSVIRSQITA